MLPRDIIYLVSNYTSGNSKNYKKKFDLVLFMINYYSVNGLCTPFDISLRNKLLTNKIVSDKPFGFNKNLRKN